MLQKTTFRTLRKHQSHTFINVLGLSLGIASCVVIFLVLRYELSFDTFHTNADRVFRVVTTFNRNGEEHNQVGTPQPFPVAFAEDFAQEAEVLTIELYHHWNQVKVGERSIIMEETPNEGVTIAFTEPSYFDFFDFPLLTGNPAQVLRQPNEVVITQTVAERLFDDPTQAMGTSLNLDDSLDLKIVGVMEPLPVNTDFPFEMLISHATLGRNQDASENWGSVSSDFQVFVMPNEMVSAGQIEDQLPDFLAKYAGEDYNDDKTVFLQPLSDMHFSPDFSNFMYRSMSREVIWSMALVALLIILTACINFINLATALATKRAREVGVRKVLGSSRRQLIVQFLSEAALITLFAVILGLGLTELAVVQLNSFAEYQNAINLSFTGSTVAFFLALTVVVTLLAGLYPAWALTRFPPVQALKNQLSTPARRRFSLRQGLVVFQFGITQILIIGTLVIAYQLRYIEEAPLGFDKEAVVVAHFQEHTPQDLEEMRNRIASHSGVKHFSLSMSPAMSGSFWISNFYVPGDSSDVDRNAQRQFADEHYLDTYGIQLIAGEGLVPSDTTNRYVVNETFARRLGYDSPADIVGTTISFNGRQNNLPITGVVADYNVASLQQKIGPLVISSGANWYRTMNLKINMRQAQDVLRHVEGVWKDVYPEAPFAYEFLDEAMAQFYASYSRTFTLIQVFSGIAILIGCLGLYGLVTFMAEQKTKEIGVRKVLGATVLNIVSLFSREFLKLVLIAFVLAAPLAYYLMRGWLQNFEYRITLSWSLFAGGIVATLIITLLTVGYRSFRAALANPVDSLRSE
ncbi:MAG: ABC transporter permease [Tunicatimonas sp.]